MSETLNTTVYDPALWAEAVAWQQECGVFDLLSDQPVDAFAARELEKASAPAAIRTDAAPRPAAAPARPAAPARAKPAAARPPTNQHARRGLEAVADIAEAEKRAAACSSIEELVAAVEDFDGCLLKDTASNTVFGDGPTDSDIMIIGEAPGADEDRQGRPFVGRSGQMLDEMLSYIGLKREEDFRITNIVFWRPPGNRKPNAGEVALCWPFSKRHIELVQPKVILAVGGLSAQTLLDPNLRITRERGKWRSLDVRGSAVPVLPTLHPAYLLRQPVNKREAWTDLLTLKQFLNNPEG
jgi:uracil-DNA glycosylase